MIGLLRYAFFLISFSLLSQEYQYTHYTTSDGLSSSEVYDIIQDKWGYLWFSTDNGLCRFDGYHFTNYTTDDGIPDNTVFNFFKGPEEKIWCVAFNQSVFTISGEKPSFLPYKHNQILKGLPDNVVIENLYFESPNSLYFTFIYTPGYLEINADGTFKNYLNSNFGDTKAYYVRKENKGFTYYLKGIHELPIPENHTVSSVQLDDDNVVRNVHGLYFEQTASTFFMCTKGLYKVSPDGEIKFIQINNIPRKIGKLDETHFWVATISGGLEIYDIHGNFNKRILDGHSISMLYIDHEDGIWISTLRNGVFHIRNKEILHVYIPNGKVGVSDLATDMNENIWVGLRNGDIYKKERSDFELVHLAQDNSIKASFFYEGFSNKLYYSSDNYIYNDYELDSLLIYHNLGFRIDPDSSEIFAYLNFSEGLLTLKRNKKVDVLKNVRVYETHYFNSNLYLACQSGLYTKEKNNAIPVYSADSLISYRINDLDTFNDQLIMATSGHGVLFYKEGQIQEEISTLEGLSSNNISKLYVENDQTLWVCTNGGLNRLNFKKDNSYEIKTISFSDGLISNEVTDIQIIEDTIWVGTREGLSFFTKKFLNSKRRHINRFLKSQGVLINDEYLSYDDSIHLRYDKNRLEFHFTGISFNESEKLTYRYKLIGLDKKWSYTTNQSIVYPSLPNGAYDFVVEIDDENTNSGVEILHTHINILPPFWTTWWFIIISTIFIFTLAYLFFKYEIFTKNRDLIREILRQGLKRIDRKAQCLIIRDAGKEIKVQTSDILFAKSEGNYLRIVTENETFLFREKVGNFLNIVPDPLEFIRVRRSHIVRIDKITQKGKKHVHLGDHEIQIGETYLKEVGKIIL